MEIDIKKIETFLRDILSEICTKLDADKPEEIFQVGVIYGTIPLYIKTVTSKNESASNDDIIDSYNDLIQQVPWVYSKISKFIEEEIHANGS